MTAAASPVLFALDKSCDCNKKKVPTSHTIIATHNNKKELLHRNALENRALHSSEFIGKRRPAQPSARLSFTASVNTRNQRLLGCENKTMQSKESSNLGAAGSSKAPSNSGQGAPADTSRQTCSDNNSNRSYQTGQKNACMKKLWLLRGEEADTGRCRIARPQHFLAHCTPRFRVQRGLNSTHETSTRS